MSYVHPDWVEHQRRRFMRPDAQRYWRPDAERLMPRETLKALGWQDPHETKAGPAGFDPTGNDDAEAAEAQRLATLRKIASLRYELVLLRLCETWRRKAIHPHHSQFQPRVPAGNPDGGEWTDGGAGSDRTRLAAADKVVLGGAVAAKLLFEAAKKVIDAYRTNELLWGFFEKPVGTVAYVEMDGEKIFGVNRQSPKNESIDDRERNNLIDRFAEQNPDVAEQVRLRRSPYDAFYHAETSVLLRAARKHGGTLAGRELDVFVDKQICNKCEVILPFVGKELGNPTVTFYDRRGKIGTIRDNFFQRAVR